MKLKSKTTLTVIFSLISFLTACRTPETTTETHSPPTYTLDLPQVTNMVTPFFAQTTTLTQTVNPTPSVTGNGIADATATSNPAPINIETPTPTPFLLTTYESMSEEFPFPIILITDTTAAHYQLTETDPTILIQTLGLTMKETCNYDRETHYFEGDERELFRMFKYEYDQLETEERGSETWLIQNTDLCLGVGYFSLFTPAVVVQTLQTGVVQFLNENQIEFNPFTQTLPELNFQAFPINYDDSHEEWLIEATFDRYDLRMVIPVYKDALGTYHLIPNDFASQPILTLFGHELKLDVDLTGDGHNEIIVVTRVDGSTAIGYPGFIDIFSWDDGSFKLLNTIGIGDESSYSAAFDTQYAIADFNGDAIPDIQVIKPYYGYDSNCSWREKHQFWWQGTEVISTIEFLEHPDEAYCSPFEIQYAGSSLIVSNFLVDNFVYPVPSSKIYDETDENLDRFIANNVPIMQRQLLSKSDLPYLHGVIQRTLARMREADLSIQEPHLLYMLGLSYELQGYEESAISTYISLIQQVPHSPWSWLAWARLKLVAG